MRDLRKLKNKRFKKGSKGPGLRSLLFLILIVAAGAGLYWVLPSNEKIKTPPMDLTSGQFYMKGRRQGSEESAPPEGKKGETGLSKEKTPVNPESFTFYKVLNSKEGEIVPLKEGLPKSEVKTEDVVRDPQLEKISQMEKEIGSGLEKKVRKDEVYTVQVAALSSETKAAGVVSKLKTEGYESYLVKEDVQKGAPLYKVRVGRFVSRMDAQDVGTLLKKNGYDTYVIKAE